MATPQDFMYLVDYLHQHGIAVISTGCLRTSFRRARLAYFDGTHLYEHADSRRVFFIPTENAHFNYGRSEVRSFLMSSAMFWLDKYHIDACAWMQWLPSLSRLFRKHNEWIPK